VHPTKAFRLSTLLRLRENARDQCRQELAESHRKDEEIGRRLDRLDAQRRNLQEEERRTAAPGAVDVDRLREAGRYAGELRARRAELERRRASLAEEIRRRRLALVEADRGVRVLEKLRERQEERCRREEDRRQAKQLDEAAVRRQVA
jgi:flagellar protein FliJ